jgi:hypothetical protein
MRTAPMFVSLDVCKTSRIALADQLGKTYIGICQSFQETLWTNTRVGRQHISFRVRARLTHEVSTLISRASPRCCRPDPSHGYRYGSATTIPADLAHAVSILVRYVHPPVLQRFAYQRISNYLICTKSIRCDGAAELETSDGFQVWCRKHQVVFHPVSPYQHTMQGHIENLVPCTRRATSSLFQAFSPPSSKGYSSGGHFLFLLLLVLSRSYSLYSGEHFLLWVLYSSLSL